MNDELTQEELAKWGYLKEEMQEEPTTKENTQKSEFEENEEKIKKAQQNFKNIDEKLDKNTKEAINSLEEKEKIEEQINKKQAELNEFKGPKEKREFTKEKLDNLEKNEDLKESLEILKEKEKIEEQIKQKEAQIEKDQEKKGKEQISDSKEVKDDKDNIADIAEQKDWNKRAEELELQHEKELEELKDKQSRLEANFQKSIDNLMSSDGINGVITALQEMDRSLEMLMKQGKEESEQKEKQRKEKLELAFDSPKFKEAVGDLVKEVYKEQKEVKNGLKEMEKEHSNYAKLQSTYEKEKKKGLDIKGYEKLKKMMGDINKETPNFKQTYPKFYKKVNDTLEQTKNKILNKTNENTHNNERTV